MPWKPRKQRKKVQLVEPAAMSTAMAQQGRSYRDLGHLTRYSAAYLCRVATGKRGPSPEAALAIAKALRVPHPPGRWLLGRRHGPVRVQQQTA
jgi:transcriptional regulator with XRE-family HTH domain